VGTSVSPCRQGDEAGGSGGSGGSGGGGPTALLFASPVITDRPLDCIVGSGSPPDRIRSRSDDVSDVSAVSDGFDFAGRDESCGYC
jgi:hypothetical protein